MNAPFVRHVPPPELGPALKDARGRMNWGLREAARNLGITHVYLRDLERGERAPSAQMAEQLISVLRITGADANAVRDAGVSDRGRSHPQRAVRHEQTGSFDGRWG